ncbi:hypothetical protein [Weissella confusa]|uniref:DUF960 domain-containing protein n=1 Tax=Weissella confusa TaxID=1583 RepID=A0A4Z0S5K9_WEICO|nr:hypothetical protein [Weissella confusa]TGE75848.1 hypothetical protein C6P11_00795 [Weissella confusa]
MFESTKSRIVTEELAKRMPEEAQTALWGMFDAMMTYKAIKYPEVEVWFADDYTDEIVGLMFVQHDGDVQQEMEMPYSGDHSWLNKGLIVEIRDEDKIVMDVSPRFLAYEAAVAEEEANTDAE